MSLDTSTNKMLRSWREKSYGQRGGATCLARVCTDLSLKQVYAGVRRGGEAADRGAVHPLRVFAVSLPVYVVSSVRVIPTQGRVQKNDDLTKSRL